MESRTAMIALVTVWSGILPASSAEAASVCELSGGVLKGELCFLPCDNPGEVRVQQPNGELTCVPPGQPAAAAPPAPPAPPNKAPAPGASPVNPAALANKATNDCARKGGVRLGVACFLPCPNPGETRVQLANGQLKCVVIAPTPLEAGTKGKDQKVPPGKKKH